MKLKEVFLEGKEVKRLLVRRSFETKIPLSYACKEVGIGYVEFLNGYINSNTNANYDIEEDKIERLLEVYGVSVRIQFLVDKTYDYEAERERLNNKYDKKKKNVNKRNNEEEGDASFDTGGYI